MIKQLVKINILFLLLFSLTACPKKNVITLEPNIEEQQLTTVSLYQRNLEANKTEKYQSFEKVEKYIKANPDLSESDKYCLTYQIFQIGMQASTVMFLLGKPDKIEIIQQPWGKQEKWMYEKGDQIVFYVEEDGIVGIEE
jgi:hypothetical protein